MTSSGDIRDQAPAEQGLAEVWRRISDRERIQFFRSFFEAYGVALRRPESFRPFRAFALYLRSIGA